MEIQEQEKKQGFAVASLSCGVIGLIGFLVPYISIFLSILAIIFYNVQKKNSDNGMATAGLVLGILGIISNIFWLLMVFIMLIAGTI